MYTVFMCDNPAQLYEAVNSIVLINKPCYCLVWIYNPQHCSFSNSFPAVCIVGAKKSIHTKFGRACDECRNDFFCEGILSIVFP